MKILKRDYNKALRIVASYEAQKQAALKIKRETGYYSILYLLEKDGPEDFRERLIKAKSPNAAIEKFMKRAPVTLKWVDEDLMMNKQSYYIGDNPLVLNYL